MAENKKNKRTDNEVSSKKKEDNKKNENVKKKNIEKNVSKESKKEEKKVVSKKVEKVTEVVEEKKEETTEPGFIKKHLGDLLLVVGVIAVVILGAFLLGGTEGESTDTDNYLVEVSYSEYEDLIESNETFVFIIESANCGHCQTYMPRAEEVANEHEVTIYYLDAAKISSEDDYDALVKSNTFFIENSQWGTPTTMIVKGNVVSDSMVGAGTVEDLEEFLKNNGIME